MTKRRLEAFTATEKAAALARLTRPRSALEVWPKLRLKMERIGVELDKAYMDIDNTDELLDELEVARHLYNDVMEMLGDVRLGMELD
jgi:hypothetical protein